LTSLGRWAGRLTISGAIHSKGAALFGFGDCRDTHSQVWKSAV
jgi:hypothetical protein